MAEPRTKGAKRFQGGFLSSEPRVTSFLQLDPNLPGMSFEAKMYQPFLLSCNSSDTNDNIIQAVCVCFDRVYAHNNVFMVFNQMGSNVWRCDLCSGANMFTHKAADNMTNK